MRVTAAVIKIGEIFAEFGYSIDGVVAGQGAALASSSSANTRPIKKLLTMISKTNAVEDQPSTVVQQTRDGTGIETELLDNAAATGTTDDTTVSSSSIPSVIKWELRVMDESHDIIADHEITDNPTKVIKVNPSSIYLVQTRIMPSSTLEWSPWSDVIRTRTFSPVKTSAAEIGEDFVTIQWDRPVRDNSLIAPEVNTEAVRRVAEISQYCLRVVRELDMYEVFSQEFATGTRSYTLHNLRPGAAHIVYARYRTLIGTMTNWSEVVRFYTQNSFELQLVRRAEDTFTVRWARDFGGDNDGTTTTTTTTTTTSPTGSGGNAGNKTDASSPLTTTTTSTNNGISAKGPSNKDSSGGVGGAGSASSLSLMGYVVPNSTVHRFELSIVGEGLDVAPLEINSSVREHTFRDLTPGAPYRVRIRCLTKDGRWGIFSKVLKVTLAQRPTLVPISVGETFLSFTWQRRGARGAAAAAAEEPQETDIEYHIRSASSEFEVSKGVFIRKGPANKKFTVESLVSNTIYFVRIRTLLMGEWGLWSEPQRFQTAKSMSLQLLERGENFFTVSWPLNALSSTSNGPLSSPYDKNSGDDTDHRFELVLVRVEEETGDRELVMQEEVIKDSDEGYRLQNLLPNTTYELRGRAWQRNRVEGTCLWGQYSNTLRVRTLQNVALRISAVGEDFAELSWTRALALKSATNNPDEELWKDLKYEVVIGCVDTGEDGIVHKEVVDTTCIIDNLLPATTYTVSVRACDDREQWGAWSHGRFHTLPAVQVSIHEIGETFVRVMWRREADSSLQELLDHEDTNGITDQPPVAQGDPVAKEFMLYIFSNDYDDDSYTSSATGYPKGGNSEVSVATSIQSHHSSYRVCDLIPDRTYTAVIRAVTPTGRWGHWSSEIRFHTTAPFRIPVNTLQVGENYIHLMWSRDDRPSLPKDVLIEDFVVTSQQIRFRDTTTDIAKELTVGPDQREEKIRGLHPATPYCVQIRACSKTGEWGQWSTPVTILTRPTIVCRDVEIAEDYVVIAWEKPKIANPQNFATGRGSISSFELRVTNKDGTHLSTFVVESPYKITNLRPNTYYCVEIKANYNDSEWGMWSRPLWCLTMHSVETLVHDIGEEHCTVRIVRQADEAPRVPEDDGNRANDIDRVLAFGKHRSKCQLCVTTANVAPPPHTPKSGTFVRLDTTDSINLPLDCRNDKVVYLAEVSFDGQDILHTIPNLKANTIYSVVARTRLDEDGTWGVWSSPTQRFVTVAKTVIEFLEIGEAFVKIRWERGQQDLLGVQNSSSVARGIGSIAKSKIKIRDSSQHFAFIDVDSDTNIWTVVNLKPAETYGVSIQIMSPAGDWGVWSAEAKVRTVPPMSIVAENITEDGVWLSWVREPDLSDAISADTCMNVDTKARRYELSIRGEGGFNYTRVIEDGTNCFFRGLQPDTIYEAWLRTMTGLWSKRYFATLPTIRVTFGNIGEHFAVVEWRRNLPSCLNKPSANGLDVTQAIDKIEGFRLRVELPGEAPILFELSSNVGTYRLRDLKPLSEYRIWMCARGHEGVWGSWNTETRVRTLAPLDLTIDSIGEDYVSVSWCRAKWVCSHGIPPADEPNLKTWEIQGTTAAYEVEVLDENGVVVGKMGTPHRTTSCTISKLMLKSIYSVCVRAKDTYGEWGLWSEPRRFVTLQPARVNILRVGEDYVQLEWQRRTRLRTIRPRRRGYYRDETTTAQLISTAAPSSSHHHSTANGSGSGVGQRSNIASRQRSGGSHVRDLPDDYEGDGFESGEDYDEDFDEEFEDEEYYDAEEGEEEEEVELSDEDFERLGDEDYENHTRHRRRASRKGARGKLVQSPTTAGVDDGFYSGPPLGANEVYPPSVVRGDEDVKQWAIRVYSSSVFGGQPGGEDPDMREFFFDADTTDTALRELRAGCTYTIALRGQNVQGVWGQWSEPVSIKTQPLIKATAVDITETSVKISWYRPPYVSAEATKSSSSEGQSQAGAFQYSFPEPNDAHNYQLTIVPLEGETPFPARDEFVVGGARVYETSQTTIELSSLAPGTRYRIVIKEQMLAQNGRSLQEGTFGGECEPIIVETILPMEIIPEDIGENQCTLTWRRKPRTNPSDVAIVPARSSARIAFYQLRVARMDANGVSIHEGSMSLKLTKSFKAPEVSYLLKHLCPNAIYAVCAQAQLENGTWGPWSAEAKFVTQKRLTLSVETIDQDSLIVSWLRQGPDWVPQRVGGVLPPPTSALTASSSVSAAVAPSLSPSSLAATSPTSAQKSAAAAAARELNAAIPPALRSIFTGDYEVKHFELVVEGVTCNHAQRIIVEAPLCSATIGGLKPNNVYIVFVRSMTAKTNAWSQPSPRVTVSTLAPLQLQIGRFSECGATVAWYRPAQSLDAHEAAILKLQAAAKAEAEQRERKARFDRQQLIQHKAEANEIVTEEELALSALAIEQSIIDAEEAAHYLSPQNVRMGLAEVSGYQLRLFGEGGMPVINGSDHLLPVAPTTAATKQSKGASKGGKRRAQGGGRGASSNHDNSDKGGGAASSSPPNSPLAHGHEEGEDEDTALGATVSTVIGETAKNLMDVKINPNTAFVKINGLREGTRYAFSIRSRNAFSEWGPWSDLQTIKTLDLLRLCHSRFGEHYINLYWHRPSEQTEHEYTTRKTTLARYTEQFKDMSAGLLEQKKRELLPDAYAKLVEEIRDWRAQQRWVTAYETALSNGEGEVLASDTMPIAGYHLRILSESGAVSDRHFEGDVRQFTLTGLTHNSMYVVLMCPSYGDNEWGSWSQPLKIMTQNTLQLNITYVGENFIEASWKRAANKKPNALDADTIIMSSTTQLGSGRQYEASLRCIDPNTGEEKDERRRIRDASSCRLDGLFSDTHYRVRIREWDPKGEWGLWGSEKRCATLSAMSTEVMEIGEDWLELKWGRLIPKMKVDYDDPSFIQRPVDDVNYYLQIEEIPEDATYVADGNDSAAEDQASGTLAGEDDVDLSNFLQSQHEKNQRESAESGGSHFGGSRGRPQPPIEREPSGPNELYHLTRRFDANTTNFRVANLSADKFYRIQVLCETTGGQLGRWSPPLVALTMCRVKVRCDLVDELVTRVSWSRDNPRRHPSLRDSSIKAITAFCDTRSYQLAAVGVDSRTKDYSLDLTFSRDTHEYKMTDLILNGCYCVRVRALDGKGRHTLWSDDVNFVTLKRLKVDAERITETSVHLEWGRGAQIASDYPPTSTSLYIAADIPTQYHLCIFSTDDFDNPLLERTFAGNVNKFVLAELTPNTAYYVRARSSNLLGEWSLWSEGRVVYTMKPLVANVVTAGESYICLNWAREAPDELTDVVRGSSLAGLGIDDGRMGGGAADGGFGAGDANQEEEYEEAFYGSADAPDNDDYFDTLVEAEARRSKQTAALTAQDHQTIGGGEGSEPLRQRTRKQFPLLDQPEHPSPVYTSARTHIHKYCVSVSRLNDNADPWIAYVDGTSNYFKVPNLRHDTVYEVAVRACYTEDEADWGVWSKRVKCGTTNLLQINVKQVGETYLHAEWRRNPNSFAEYGVAVGRPEETLCYQFLVHDFTDVAIGDEQKIDLQTLLVKDQLLNQKSNVFNNLMPNRRYRLCVRRWYKPAVLAVSSAPATQATRGMGPAADNADANNATPPPAPSPPTAQGAHQSSSRSQPLLSPVSPEDGNAATSASPSLTPPSINANSGADFRAYINAIGGLDGSWSEVVTVATHKPMAVIVSDISEGGMLIRWERDPEAVSHTSRHCLKVPFTVNSYHVHIDEMSKNGTPIPHSSSPGGAVDGSANNTSPSSPTAGGGGILSTTSDSTNTTGGVLRFSQEFPADELSFRARDLKPDTVYRIEVRCSMDKVWGPWSPHAFVITLPRLQVTLSSIGEDYSSLSWGRTIRQLTAPDGTVALTGSIANVEKYELDMEGLDHHFELKRRFRATRTNYKVKRLEPSRVYSITMRSCEYAPGTMNEEWSDWSQRVVFATLKPLILSFGKVAEQFVHVSWSRDPQSAAEYAQYDPHVLLGKATDVLSYHLCAFTMDQMPAAAILDKQFSGEITQYRIENLAPNTSYIMIARACNWEQQWGLWGEERVVTTQRVLTTDILSIGENYVTIKWSRVGPDDEEVRRITAAQGGALVAAEGSGTPGGRNNNALQQQQQQRRDPTSYHLCLTSEAETIDRRFAADECNHTADDQRLPMYTVRGLRSDTKYILSIQACYGDDEWGTWSAPVTFATINNISVKVSNITESSAEFTWGRAQQNPTFAADLGILVWRPTVVRYQLLLRKVEDMRAQEMHERELALASQGLSLGGGDPLLYPEEGRFDEGDHGLLRITPPPTPTTTTGDDGVPTPMTARQTAPASSKHEEADDSAADVEGTANEANPSRPTTAPTGVRSYASSTMPHFFFEQEMDVRLVKYVQTLSRIDKLEVNTEYHFQVRALDDHNEWGQWSEVFFDTPPSPPQNLMMRKDGAMLLLSWDPPSRINRYMYFIEQSVAKDPADASSGGGSSANKDRGAKSGGRGRGGGGSSSATASGAASGGKRDGVSMEWRVVDTVEDTVARVRAFGPIHRVRCRVRCCKLNTTAHLFSRYSAAVTVNSNAGVPSVEGLHVSSISKSTAVIEWRRIDPSSTAPSSPTGGAHKEISAADDPHHSLSAAGSSALTPAPPPPRVVYRVMLAINNQPLINVATLKSNVFELTDLTPSTSYTVQVITETDIGTCQRNSTLRFSTKAEGDRGVYKWAPNQPPLGELTPPPQDRTLLMVGGGNGAVAGGNGLLGVPVTSSQSSGLGAGGRHSRLPSLLGSSSGAMPTTMMTPRPPQKGSQTTAGVGGSALSSPLTYGGASTPRGSSASAAYGVLGQQQQTPYGNSVGSGLLTTPPTQSRRPPGTAPHGATRSKSGAGAAAANTNFNNQYPPPAAPNSARRPVPPQQLGNAGGGVVLPPVSQHPGSTSGARRANATGRPRPSSSAVEHIEYVGFVQSDEEK